MPWYVAVLIIIHQKSYELLRMIQWLFYEFISYNVDNYYFLI